MRYKQPYTVYPRKLKSGKVIYYYQTYDEQGKRTAPRSTGQTTKTAALHWVAENYKNKTLIVIKKYLLSEYAKPFWKMDTCPYIKAKLKRGGRITPGYAEIQRRNLELHVLPHLGKYSIKDITPLKIEKFMFAMKDKGYAAETVNHCIKALRIVLEHAVKEKIIQENPAKNVKPLIGESKKKSILTPVEVKKIFSITWESHMHFTMNMLSATTGLRLGEIQAIKRKYVNPEYIEIAYSWGRKYGLKETKNYEKRDVPIPPRVSENLLLHIESNNLNKQDFIFFHPIKPGEPVDHKTVAIELYKAFELIGIKPEERKKRNVTFHSWRHFFNTYFRSKIHDSKLRRITGHKTKAMTEHYTHFQIEDFLDVVELQEGIF